MNINNVVFAAFFDELHQQFCGMFHEKLSVAQRIFERLGQRIALQKARPGPITLSRWPRRY